MDDQAFHHLQIEQFKAFGQHLVQLNSAPTGETLNELTAQYTDLSHRPDAIMDEGPALVARMLITAPQLAERFPRDLLWYLGGECLHFMPDEEIERLSAMDEERRATNASGGSFNWIAARASAMRLQ